MIKKLIFILVIVLNIFQIFASTIITFESDFGVKNFILYIFLVTLFLFWMFIYRFTTPLEFNKRNLIKSTTNFSIKIMCWVWFISLVYVFQSILFISSGDTFLTDKLDLLYSVFYLTLIVFGILGLFNSVKLYNKMSGTTEFFKEFIFEVKSGGRK